MILIDAIPNGRTMIGRLGENDHRGIRFPSAATLAMYPDASVTVLHQRPGDPAAYPVNPANIQIQDGRVIWCITSSDLMAEGTGTAELVYTQGEVIAKTELYRTQIQPALDGSGTPPEPWESWQESLVQTVQGAYDAAEDAKEWATGLDKNGNPVPPTDEHYENNAYYHSQQAAGSAQAAETAKDAIEGMTVSATELQPGATPTVTKTVDPQTGAVNIDYGIPPGEDGQDGVSPTITVTDITGGHRITITDANGSHTVDVMDGATPTVPVTDVQVNGTSVLSNGVANVPAASSNVFGVMSQGNGLKVSGTTGKTLIDCASPTNIKNANETYKPIVPTYQDQSTFYGLASAAGDSTQSASDNAVGTYTADAKKAIRKMLGIPNTTWELIGTKTIDEDATNISIQLDSNGLAFKLSKMMFIFDAPPSTTGAVSTFYGQVYLNDGTTNTNTTFPSLRYTTATGRMYARGDFEVNDGAPLSEAVIVASSEGNTQNVQSMAKFIKVKYLTGVIIYQSSSSATLVPAGSTLYLYGIRIDE